MSRAHSFNHLIEGACALYKMLSVSRSSASINFLVDMQLRETAKKQKADDKGEEKKGRSTRTTRPR
jgi:hypothetical protein